VRTAEEQTRAWETHKAKERDAPTAGALDGVTRALPALVRAGKLQRRAARAGFDWPDVNGPLAKCREELEEVESALAGGKGEELADELGDLLFSCVNLARHAGVDAEDALRRTSSRFERRFRAIESRLAERGMRPEDADPETLDDLWEAVKRSGV
jgi:ATP diphosphatase